METFLKGAINRCSNLTFIFKILKLSIFLIRKSLYTLLVIWYHARHSLNINNQNVSFNCAERCWMLYVPM